MAKLKVLIADDHADCRESLSLAMQDDKFEVVGNVSNGRECLNTLRNTKVDVLMLDLVMPEVDGFGVMEELRFDSSIDKPHIFVHTNLMNDNFIDKALSLGADYYFVKPTDVNTIKNRIKDFFMPVPKRRVNDEAVIRKSSEKTLEEKIANIFLSVGIPAHIKGYQFLRDAIKLVVADPQIINSITKRLYPSVAAMFDTSSSKVERAIRHAIEVAWSRGKIDNINKLFGFKVYGSNDKPTNGEFIALVADKLLIESMN